VPTNMAAALRDLLKKDEIYIVPEFADCAAAKAAELNGFKVIMVSSGDLACSLTGIPDLELLSLDEFVAVTDRITNMSPLPLIIDADDGFGRPLNAYYACQRLMKAGAAGVLITDAAEHGRRGVLPIEDATLKFKAAREGLGPDGFLVARVDTNPETQFEETIERSRRYREAGADMICILWMHLVQGDKLALIKKIAAEDPGLKWYPDLNAHDAEAGLDIDELVQYGYQLVGVHFSAHAAMLAMLDTGRHVFESRTNTYVETHYRDTGYNMFTSMSMFGLSDGYWPNIESRFVKDPQDAIAVRNADYFVRPDDKY
jgi:methylisocitrate lyase